MRLKLYVNGLYWRDVETKGTDYYFEHAVTDGSQSERFVDRLPGPTATMYRARFEIHYGGIAGVGDIHFALCNDPAVYVDIITGRLRCHSKEALRDAAYSVG